MRVASFHEEMESLKENNAFELTPPESKKTVGSKWVCTIKKNPDGSERYKVRFIAWGFSQTKRLDYQDFPPYCILMQTAAQYDLTVHQMDVITAYLHAPIDC